MNLEEFWKLIDKTREAAGGDPRKQSDLLTSELKKLPIEEIISFERIFDELKDNAYIGNLWDAATLIMNGCSDDGFEEFREWLVGRGKEAYENALKDPETLVEVLEVGEQIFPTLLSPAMDAYEQVTGKEMPPMPRPWAELHGRPTINIDTEESELREMLVPLGFIETELKAAAVARFQRNQYTVGTMLDSDDDGPFSALYVSNELHKDGGPVHQQTMILDYHQYGEKKKKALEAVIQTWLVTTGL